MALAPEAFRAQSFEEEYELELEEHHRVNGRSASRGIAVGDEAADERQVEAPLDQFPPLGVGDVGEAEVRLGDVLLGRTFADAVAMTKCKGCYSPSLQIGGFIALKRSKLSEPPSCFTASSSVFGLVHSNCFTRFCPPSARLLSQGL